MYISFVFFKKAIEPTNKQKYFYFQRCDHNDLFFLENLLVYGSRMVKNQNFENSLRCRGPPLAAEVSIRKCSYATHMPKYGQK